MVAERPSKFFLFLNETLIAKAARKRQMESYIPLKNNDNFMVAVFQPHPEIRWTRIQKGPSPAFLKGGRRRAKTSPRQSGLMANKTGHVSAHGGRNACSKPTSPVTFGGGLMNRPSP
jgi:hypothetical protein